MLMYWLDIYYFLSRSKAVATVHRRNLMVSSLLPSIVSGTTDVGLMQT